jgi:hypothetical protein
MGVVMVTTRPHRYRSKPSSTCLSVRRRLLPPAPTAPCSPRSPSPQAHFTIGVMDPQLASEAADLPRVCREVR